MTRSARRACLVQKGIIYRLAILGISLKKLDLSTSLMVAAQDILYEKRCARIDWLTGMLRPPKKKKLERTGGDKERR